MSSWRSRARAIISKWNPPINVLELVFRQGPGKNKPENACSTLIGEFHLMILLGCSYPRRPNGSLRFRDNLFSREWAKPVLSHTYSKKRNTECDTKTATLFYHAAAAGSYPMGWSSCRVCPSTHTSLRSTICVLTFSLALVAALGAHPGSGWGCHGCLLGLLWAILGQVGPGWG